jgi:hypothetical protein
MKRSCRLEIIRGSRVCGSKTSMADSLIRVVPIRGVAAA